MFYIFCLLGCMLGAANEVQAKTCRDFDKDNKEIGQHSAWLHCSASDGASGTVNSCDCASPVSTACIKACSPNNSSQPKTPNATSSSLFAVALGI